MFFFRKLLINNSFYTIIINSLKRNKYLIKTKNNLNFIHENNINFNYFLIFGTGYIAYKYYKKNVFPCVEAVSINDRRQQFNLVADVVDNAKQAVVYIEIKDTRRFDIFTGKPITISNGSGFIIKEDGLILTNAHVVTNKPYSKVDVQLYDGRIYKGVVEDVDMQSDLATVRISAKDLPVMKLGKSSELRAGEFVIAMGSPLSLSNTVTFGVISSTNRASQELGLHGKDITYLQTDAAITFGNSGGPLINLNGEAIGVNSMKVTAGISFAIPSDYVQKFLDNTKGLRQSYKDQPRRRYMGITMLTLNSHILHELQERNQNIPPDIKSGVLVWKVILGSPAHIGNLQPGDIVTHINSIPIKSATDVYTILSESINTIKLKIIREGKTMEIDVKPEDIV